MDALARRVREGRLRKGWSLREAEAQTGIHNAHLSQIEKGHIEKPGMSLLWRLSEAYGLDYAHLLELAGHTSAHPRTDARSLQGALLHASENLSNGELHEVLKFLDEVRQRRKGDDDGT